MQNFWYANISDFRLCWQTDEAKKKSTTTVKPLSSLDVLFFESI